MNETTFQDAQEIVSKINNRKGTRTTVAKLYEMSENTLSRRLKHHGYIYNQTTKKYDFTSPTTNERNNESTKQQPNKGTKKVKKEQTKKTNEPKSEQTNEPTTIIRKRASFDIDVKLLKELKIYAIQRDKTVYEIVEHAIRKEIKGE
jgi:hypothetical protein